MDREHLKIFLYDFRGFGMSGWFTLVDVQYGIFFFNK